MDPNPTAVSSPARTPPPGVRRRSTVLAAAGLALAAGLGGASLATGAPAAGAGRYLADVGALEAAQSRAPAPSGFAAMDAAARRMGAYRLSEPLLERERARAAVLVPRITAASREALRRLDAHGAPDEGDRAALLTETARADRALLALPASGVRAIDDYTLAVVRADLAVSRIVLDGPTPAARRALDAGLAGIRSARPPGLSTDRRWMLAAGARVQRALRSPGADGGALTQALLAWKRA
jgi:hypothetical protein